MKAQKDGIPCIDVEGLKKFNKDKSMLPMLINDNYLTFFENSNTNYADKLKLLSQCTHYIMLGRILTFV